jgi:hypothetical protein
LLRSEVFEHWILLVLVVLLHQYLNRSQPRDYSGVSGYYISSSSSSGGQGTSMECCKFGDAMSIGFGVGIQARSRLWGRRDDFRNQLTSTTNKPRFPGGGFPTVHIVNQVGAR